MATLAPAAGEPEPNLSIELPTTATSDAVPAIARRLQALAQRWRDLDDSAAISLTPSRRTA